MKKLLFLFIPAIIYPQQLIESELDSAFTFAKKGVYWALNNYNKDKSRTENDLISDNKLYATVKVNRGVEGIKIESKGFFNSTEVNLKIYRSDEYLEREGYIKKEDQVIGETKKKKKS